ncbi:MAG: DUF6494 family protein [Xanthobacteraceae bacterium]
MPTETEIEAEAKKQCLRAFEPYTYGPYFDALRDECRRMARETLEARERAKDMRLLEFLKERPKMNEEVVNTSLRKFLKTVGVTSQREIEKAIRTAVGRRPAQGQRNSLRADGAHHRQGRPQLQDRGNDRA